MNVDGSFLEVNILEYAQHEHATEEDVKKM